MPNLLSNAINTKLMLTRICESFFDPETAEKFVYFYLALTTKKNQIDEPALKNALTRFNKSPELSNRIIENFHQQMTQAYLGASFPSDEMFIFAIYAVERRPENASDYKRILKCAYPYFHAQN